MSSMLLIEAALVGKQVMSIQIGLKVKDPFVLSRRGITNTVTSYSDLVSNLNKVFNRKYFHDMFSVSSGATKNILAHIQGDLFCS